MNQADERFPKYLRIRKRKEFLEIQYKGRKINTEHFLICIKERERNGLQGYCVPRLGITTSKKIGKSTIRNKVKRILREVFRKNKYRWIEGVDIVIIVKPREDLRNLDYYKVESELNTVLLKSKGDV